MEISLSMHFCGLIFRFLSLFSVAGATLLSQFVPPFNDSEQLLKGLNRAGQSLVPGAITMVSNGVLVLGG